MWVAEIDGEAAGCIMLSETAEPDVGQLRLFFVEKKYWGNGIGSALTDALMDKARRGGYRKILLWTADVLTAARRQYEKMGFVCVESVPNDKWSLSGQTLNEEKWEMAL